MTASDHLSRPQFVEPIHENEARGNSRPVTGAEFQDLAARGREHLDTAARVGQSTSGLDKRWDAVKDDAYQASREPWGGRTINHQGRSVHPNANVYAGTTRRPGQSQIHVPLDAPAEHFHSAMDRAREEYKDQLQAKGGHLGVFHDADEGRIDIDPVVIVHSRRKADEVGAYTHATGGFYHFRTGNGHFPPHVKG